MVLLFSLLFLLTGLPGCSFDSEGPEDVTIKFINALFVRSKDGKPTAEERFEAILSVFDESVTDELKESLDFHEEKDEMLEFLEEVGKKGITGVYFIAENPDEPQTESYSNLWVKIPASSLPEADKRNGEESAILNIILQRRGEEWKVVDIHDDTESLNEKKIDWIEVKPYR